MSSPTGNTGNTGNILDNNKPLKDSPERKEDLGFEALTNNSAVQPENLLTDLDTEIKVGVTGSHDNIDIGLINDSSNELPVQTIRDDDDLALYGSDSYIELDRKLMSARNSLELLAIGQGHQRKNPVPGIVPVDLQTVNEVYQNEEATTDLSKSVILNATNANIKANGHHVVWVDNNETTDSHPTEESEDVTEFPPEPESEQEETDEVGITVSNHSIQENPLINAQNDLGVLSSDDDLFTNEKVDTSRLLSVEGKPIPDPNYVAGQMASEYHALINLNYKKDCRSWLYKNKQSREKVRSILNEVSSRRGNARR